MYAFGSTGTPACAHLQSSSNAVSEGGKAKNESAITKPNHIRAEILEKGYATEMEATRS